MVDVVPSRLSLPCRLGKGIADPRGTGALEEREGKRDGERRNSKHSLVPENATDTD